jgi:hypothetical protein
MSSIVAGQLQLCVDGDEGIGWFVGCIPPVMAVPRGSELAFCCAVASSHCPSVAISCGAFVTVLWAPPGFLALPKVRDCGFWVRLLVVVGLGSFSVV